MRTETEPTKGPSSERPDFEEKAEQIYPYKDNDSYEIKNVQNDRRKNYIDICESVWNEHVIPLKQEIERLREELKSK